MRRSTEGSVRMVGPMSKRNPFPPERRLAAEPVVPLEKSNRVTAGGKSAGCCEAAESAPDDANAFVPGSVHFLSCWDDCRLRARIRSKATSARHRDFNPEP